MGEGFIAEQARPLGSQLHHFGGDRAIVARAAALTARGPGAKGVLAEVAPGRELQEWFDARATERYREMFRVAALGGDARCARNIKVRQANEVLLVQEHEPALFVRQHVLSELRGKRRQPLGDRGQSRLGLSRGARAGAGEIEMIALEHARLLDRKPELVL